MKDKVTLGFLAGLAGGIVMNILDQIMFFSGLTNLVHPDWATALILGTRATSIPEFIFGFLMQLFHAGIMGIVFTAFMSFAGRENHLFKGIIYGVTVFLITLGTAILLYTPAINPLSLNTAISNVMTSGVYGLVLSQTYHTLLNKAYN